MLTLMMLFTSIAAPHSVDTALSSMASRNPLRARIDLILNRFDPSPGRVTVLAYHEFQNVESVDDSHDNFGFDRPDERSDDRSEENRGPSSESSPEEDPVVLT